LFLNLLMAPQTDTQLSSFTLIPIAVVLPLLEPVRIPADNKFTGAKPSVFIILSSTIISTPITPPLVAEQVALDVLAGLIKKEVVSTGSAGVINTTAVTSNGLVKSAVNSFESASKEIGQLFINRLNASMDPIFANVPEAYIAPITGVIATLGVSIVCNFAPIAYQMVVNSAKDYAVEHGPQWYVLRRYTKARLAEYQILKLIPHMPKEIIEAQNRLTMAGNRLNIFINSFSGGNIISLGPLTKQESRRATKKMGSDAAATLTKISPNAAAITNIVTEVQKLPFVAGISVGLEGPFKQLRIESLSRNNNPQKTPVLSLPVTVETILLIGAAYITGRYRAPGFEHALSNWNRGPAPMAKSFYPLNLDTPALGQIVDLARSPSSSSSSSDFSTNPTYAYNPITVQSQAGLTEDQKLILALCLQSNLAANLERDLAFKALELKVNAQQFSQNPVKRASLLTVSLSVFGINNNQTSLASPSASASFSPLSPSFSGSVTGLNFGSKDNIRRESLKEASASLKSTSPLSQSVITSPVAQRKVENQVDNEKKAASSAFAKTNLYDTYAYIEEHTPSAPPIPIEVAD
jgi:hypothetical protein